ncbi:response regulator transcription factor [Parvibacter caecicola]|uniref:DNA-binding response OmpR family regulator n=1 Tax=Parvibacter caecicola TaxID=747645 RepID=A0A3N0AA80_9ACTN|nr:response regulator transcription factor [Parvibacter caecicola]MBB3170284.1 DNA-binding response OmpR family regulator [Parvibacter caecicola]MCR2041750.1 response regulator transcription factor [Parvibacter caecicola]RNL10493.1 DNA-binding response regulator [Parvibacter caecicola]TJW12469.1 response regulator transcription factor [Parvibacter caecicola]
MHALVVEDDAAIVAALTSLLKSQNIDVTSTATQSGACQLLAERSFDIALLDVTLAEGSGFVVCAAARNVAPAMPIIFLTASDDEYSTVAGLDMGAADYIAKPFRPRELLSRIQAALRRSAPEQNVLEAGDVRLNITSGTVTKAGAEVVLSALEYRLLLYFLQHKNRVITRENLRDAIWDSAGEYISDNALNVYMKRLREKVEADSSNPQILVTVRGLGFKVCG